MKIFLSSVMRGMKEYRDAAAKALTTLGHEVKRAEDYGALPDSPQQACLAGVREADLVVLLLGEAYGTVQPSGLSATHEEYREAKERCEVLAFVQKGVSHEVEQEAFAQEVRDWQTGKYTGSFSTPDDLRDAIIGSVHNLELSRAKGQVDEREMVDRIKAYIPPVRNGQEESSLFIIVAGGPKQQVLRPSDIENKDLSDSLTDKAISRSIGFFTRREGTHDRIEKNALILEQEHASILLDELGTIRLMQSPRQGSSGSQNRMLFSPGFIEEDIRDSILMMLKFAGVILDHVDPQRRLSHVVVIPVLFHTGFPSWKTRAEQAQNAGGETVMTRIPNPIVIEPSVVSRNRSALSLDADRWAEDLTVLLRREFRQKN